MKDNEVGYGMDEILAESGHGLDTTFAEPTESIHPGDEEDMAIASIDERNGHSDSGLKAALEAYLEDHVDKVDHIKLMTLVGMVMRTSFQSKFGRPKYEGNRMN